jgi:hypothetical protein
VKKRLEDEEKERELHWRMERKKEYERQLSAKGRRRD